MINRTMLGAVGIKHQGKVFVYIIYRVDGMLSFVGSRTAIQNRKSTPAELGGR